MAISKFIQMDTKGSSLTQEVILEVENVFKEFTGVKVLNNVNFRVVEVEIHWQDSENGLLF